MKTRIILLSFLMLVSSFTFAQVKSKKTITKKSPKKTYAIKKKISATKNESIINAAPTLSYNKYTDGYWNYSLEESSSREYDNGSNTTYYVVLSVNGEKVSSSVNYTEYYDNESGDTSVSLTVNGRYSPTMVENPKEWLKQELKYYIRKEYGGSHFNF